MWNIIIWLSIVLAIQVLLVNIIFNRLKRKIPRIYVLMTIAFFTFVTLIEKIQHRLELNDRREQLNAGTYEAKGGIEGIRILTKELMIDAVFIGLSLTALVGFRLFYKRPDLRKDYLTAFGISLLIGIPLGFLK